MILYVFDRFSSPHITSHAHKLKIYILRDLRERERESRDFSSKFHFILTIESHCVIFIFFVGRERERVEILKKRKNVINVKRSNFK